MRVCHSTSFAVMLSTPSSGGSTSTFASKAIRKPSCQLRARLPFPYRHYRSPKVHPEPHRYRPQPSNINEPPSWRHVGYRKVFFNCGHVDFLFVQSDDIPLLPFQLLQYRPAALLSHTKKATLEWAKPKHTSSKTRNEPTISSGQGADCPCHSLLISPLRRPSYTATSFGVSTHSGCSSSRGENSLLSRTPSASLHGRQHRLGLISYPTYSHALPCSRTSSCLAFDDLRLQPLESEERHPFERAKLQKGSAAASSMTCSSNRVQEARVACFKVGRG